MGTEALFKSGLFFKFKVEQWRTCIASTSEREHKQFLELYHIDVKVYNGQLLNDILQTCVVSIDSD